MFFLFCDFHFATFYRMENPTKSAEYERKYESLRDSIHAVLYSDNLWHDFNIVTRYFKLKTRTNNKCLEKKYNQAAHRRILSQQPCSSLLRLHPSLPRPWDGGRRNRKAQRHPWSAGRSPLLNDRKQVITRIPLFS